MLGRPRSNCVLLFMLFLPVISQDQHHFFLVFDSSSHLTLNTSTLNSSVARESDIFVYSAVHLALERTKQDNDTRSSSGIEFHSVVSEDGAGFYQERSTEILFNIFREVVSLAEEFKESLSVLRGSLGPGEDYVLGKSVVTLARNYLYPQVSYGLTDSRFNESPGYFHTLPSTLALVHARLALLYHFDWLRIGLLSSVDQGYRYQKEVFSQLHSSVLEEFGIGQFTLAFEGVSSHLGLSLRELHRNGINIILGFFTAAEARTVLCEASGSSYNLTSPNHVWILPAYYGPDWWRVERENSFFEQKTKNCTEQEMRDILQSTIFIDPVKFPPMGTSLGEFYDYLLYKTVELYPELDSYEELWPLLLNSRAVSAYDATLLLVNSLVNNTVDTDLIRGSMLCERCRVYPAGTLTVTEQDYCDSIRPVCHNSSHRVQANAGNLEEHFIKNTYGQVMISQFNNGTLCPIVVYWPTDLPLEGQELRNFIPIFNLTSGSLSELGLDPLVELSQRANCPQEFVWEGGQAPVTRDIGTAKISDASLIIVGVLTGILEILIVFLIVFTVVYRDNKYVKPTSPRLNIAMLVAAFIATPLSLFEGIVLSGNDYFSSSVFPSILCQYNIWISELAITFFFVVFGGKTRRLYRIFHNKSLTKLKYLDDHYLLLWAAAMLFPEIIVIAVLNGLEPHIYISLLGSENNMNSQIVRLSRCSAEMFVSNFLANFLLVYKSLLFLAIAGIVLLIKSPPEVFVLDLYMTRFSFLLSFAVSITGVFLGFFVTDHVAQFEMLWWSRVAQYIFAPGILITGLFLYQVVLVFKDSVYRSAERVQRKMTRVNECVDYKTSLEAEREQLSTTLREKEIAIAELKAKKSSSHHKQTSV